MSATAEEPAHAFLDGLRARGYHDVAMDYLDQMQLSRLAPADLKQTILYEKSLLLIDASRQQRDPAIRGKQLDQAQEWLQQFIEAKSENHRINAARSKLGSLIVERARMKSEESRKNNDPQLLEEARKLYDRSFKVFDELQASVDVDLSKIPKVLNTRDRKDAELIAKRKQLRADYLQTELLEAAIREEVADTFPQASQEQTEYLTEAADIYDGIYKNYRTLLAGRYARMYQGRCYQRLGRTREALGYFGEILDQPNEPETLMILKAKTLAMAMEVWLSPGERKYVEAIRNATRWFDDTPRDKQRDAAWIAIRYHLARAFKMQADDAKNSQSANRTLITESLESAKKELQFVAGESGEFQEPAQKLLEQLGGPNVAEEEPETFMAAQALAKQSLDAMTPASATVQNLQQQLVSEQEPSKKDALAEKLTAAQQKLSTAQSDAIDYYRLALELADDQTPQSNVNLIQYFLCYIYFSRQDYYDAALVGEFVARRYPDSPGASQCAKIAIGCYLKLLEQCEDNFQFEVERLASAGAYLADTWPDDEQTVQTLATLIPHLINSDAVDQAADFVRRLPEDSPARGEYELVTGQASWGEYRGLEQQIASRSRSTGEDADASEQKLDRLKRQAGELLVAGYKRLPEEPEVNRSNATALLSLAQLYLKDEEFTKAIEVLEHPVLGPLKLVREKNEAASNPIFVEETYRTALRAYVASLAGGGPRMMEKAKAVIAAMKQALGDDAAGRKRMLGVYVNLAQDVQRQMQAASPELKVQLSSVFEAFLLELTQGSNEVNVLHWVADTFAKLAAELNEVEGLNENARKYYQQADAAFEKVLIQPATSPKLATQVKIQLADVRFHKQEYDSSLKLYNDVLSHDPKAINVQIGAARLLQAWGQQDAKRYQQAFKGISGPGEEATIWGWAKISMAAVQHPQFRQEFYEARYEISHCLFLLAGSETGAEKANLLADAEKRLTKTATLYPQMGDWKPKYDALLNDIQSARKH